MRNSSRILVVVLSVAAACSRSTDQPALPDDLKQDLARVGGGDVQLAGSARPKLDIVSSAERASSHAPAKSTQVSHAPSARTGLRAPAPSVRRDTPAPQPAPVAADAVPAEPQPAPEPVIAQPAPIGSERPHAPAPSTQREPRGGWRTPGQIIRNAPFPINP